MTKNIKLYRHKTDGGAEYLTDKFIEWKHGGKSGKEGIFEGAKYIVRLDGEPELTICDDTQTETMAFLTEDAGAIALLRCLPTRELEAAYRRAKSDETDKGQHSSCLIGRELIRRASRLDEIQTIASRELERAKGEL